MKEVAAELAANSSEKLRDVVIGVAGTGVTITLQSWQSAAAIFAGVSTGLWMLTQIVLAILARSARKKSRERPT